MFKCVSEQIHNLFFPTAHVSLDITEIDVEQPHACLL